MSANPIVHVVGTGTIGEQNRRLVSRDDPLGNKPLRHGPCGAAGGRPFDRSPSFVQSLASFGGQQPALRCEFPEPVDGDGHSAL